MPDRIVVGFDGSPAARRALDFAVKLAQSQGASIVLAYVLEWSPYSFLSNEELAERHKRRKEEVSRAQTAVLDPVLEKLAGSGVSIEAQIRYGHSAEMLVTIARDTGATQMVVGRDGNGGLAARMFGSTAGTLVQIATLPCTIVP
ncbi:universal stress protein [Roseivivax isoporae]|uniref:Universal stress protein n=1 Tax=Roseivivax isoporae LMG 25204 TaxID=1449351 RepID=X7FBZ6_9RHOB|nr:universal stress protein [Roseivivax isoporae]ETX30437.1 universal stress protein [Roseivivax isoporae LMG 25204]